MFCVLVLNTSFVLIVDTQGIITCIIAAVVACEYIMYNCYSSAE